jgi:hypothetical protein
MAIISQIGSMDGSSFQNPTIVIIVASQIGSHKLINKTKMMVNQGDGEHN